MNSGTQPPATLWDNALNRLRFTVIKNALANTVRINASAIAGAYAEPLSHLRADSGVVHANCWILGQIVSINLILAERV